MCECDHGLPDCHELPGVAMAYMGYDGSFLWIIMILIISFVGKIIVLFEILSVVRCKVAKMTFMITQGD